MLELTIICLHYLSVHTTEAISIVVFEALLQPTQVFFLSLKSSWLCSRVLPNVSSVEAYISNLFCRPLVPFRLDGHIYKYEREKNMTSTSTWLWRLHNKNMMLWDQGLAQAPPPIVAHVHYVNMTIPRMCIFTYRKHTHYKRACRQIHAHTIYACTM